MIGKFGSIINIIGNWPYFIYHSRFVEKKPKSTLVLDDNKFQSSFVQIDKNQLTKKKFENLSLLIHRFHSKICIFGLE